NVARLALPVAGAVAAHAVDAAAARALIGRGARGSERLMRRADAGGAVVTRHAVVVDHAVAQALGRVADVRPADARLHGPPAAGAVAAGAHRGEAGVAACRAAARGPLGEHAGLGGGAVAGASADRAVGRACRTAAAGRADHGAAGARAAGDVAGFALSVARAVAADAVGAEARATLRASAASRSRVQWRHAHSAEADAAARAVAVGR